MQTVEQRVLLERIAAPDQNSSSKVIIGSENPEESLHNFDVIVCRYEHPDGVGGANCVVGPTRMGYAIAIGGTSHMAHLMSRMVKRLGAGENESQWNPGTHAQ